MHPCPRRFVGVQSQNPQQAEGRVPVLLRGDEPGAQRRASAVEYGPGRHRRPTRTSPAHPEPGTRAPESPAPHLEPVLELPKRLGVVQARTWLLRYQIRHAACLLQLSRYPIYQFNPDLAPGSGPFGPSDHDASYGPLDRLIVEVGDQCTGMSGPGMVITVFNDAGTTFVRRFSRRTGAGTGTGASTPSWPGRGGRSRRRPC
ncbi:hypothetical protein HNP00_002057 [Arthrobacter sp. AZCC_0090]|nr:hypothetical protein [Arthrobacter sp. AZCC_0090]